MALRQLTPEEQNKVRGGQGAAPGSLGVGASATVSNPRDRITTPAQQASSNVPTSYTTPATVQPGQSQSQLRSLTANEANNIQAARDKNYSQNTTNPGLTSNPRDMQAAAGGGVQQDTTIGGVPNPNDLSFGNQLLRTPAPQAPAPTTPDQMPTGVAQPVDQTMGQTAPAPSTPTGNPAQGAPGQPSGAPIEQGQPQPPQGAQTGPEGQINAAAEGMQNAASQYLQYGQQAAQDTYDAAENARRLDYIAALGSTNAREMAKSFGVNLEDMSLQQLENLAVSSGLQPDPATIQRIRDEGAAAIDSIKMERGDQQAELKFTQDQTARAFDRALTDREKFNLAQDAKLRNAMAVFGGGSQQLGSNMEVMAKAEEGKKALEDLTVQYGGRMDSLGRQMNGIIREYGNMERQVNNQTTDLIQAKYAEVQKTMKELRAQGVTNAKDMQTAMLPLMKEYTSLYSDATKWQAEQLIGAQKTAFDQATKIQEMQATQDRDLSARYGVVFQDGQMVTGPDGNPIPTADTAQFLTTEDRMNRQLEQDAAQFSQRLGFDISKEEFSQMMEQAKFTQTVEEFNTNTGLKISEMEYNQLKDAADREITMADKGLGYTGGGTVDLAKSTGSFKPGNSVYSITPTPNGINIDAPYKGGKRDANGDIYGATLDSGRRQCGEFVNDVLGIPGFFQNEFSQKKTKVSMDNPPMPGSAFLLNIAPPYGHVGVVKEVLPDGRLKIAESNYDGNEHYRERTVSVADLQKQKLVGFTGGASASQPKLEKKGGGTGKQLGETQVKMLSDAKQLSTVMGDIDSLINDQKVWFGPVGGNIRGLNPYDTDQKAAEAQLRRATQIIGSFMEGGVLRKEDEEKYAKMLPQTTDSREVAKQKMEGVKRMLDQKRQGYISDFSAAGYDTSGFKDMNLGSGSASNTRFSDIASSALNALGNVPIDPSLLANR